MKTWQNILSLILAVCMICSCAVCALADESEEADLHEVEQLLEALEETTITKERFEALLDEAGKSTDNTAPYYSDTVALVIDGEEVSPAKLTYCLANQFQSFVNSYGQYAAYFGLDVSGGIAGLAEQKCAMLEEGTWLDFFLQQAVDSLQQSIALRRIAAEEGITIAEEETSEMRESFEEFDTIVQQYGYADGNEFITANYGLGNDVNSLLNFLTEFALAGRVYDQFEQQFRENVTTEEILEQFPDPTISIRHILIMAEQDENGEWTDEAKEAAKVRAEEILQEWAAGDATEESFAALAEKYSEDPGSSSNGGLYSNVSKGQMVEEFDAFCFDENRQPGDTGIVYGSNGGYAGYHVMYFVATEKPEDNEEARESIAMAHTGEWLKEQVEGMEITMLPYYKIAGHTLF